MKYTIEQIKKSGEKIVVMLNNEEQYNKLRKLKFNLCDWYKPSLYSVNSCSWGSDTTTENQKCYKDRTCIDYSDIIFEENFENLLIFN